MSPPRSRPGGFRAAAGLALWLLLQAGAPQVAHGQAEPDITESQRRLEQIRREREELREQMARIRSRVSDLSSELTNLDQQVATSAGLVSELEFQLAQRERQIEINTRELLMTRDRLAERRAVLYRRVRDIYKRGPLHTLEVLLASSSFSDLLNRYKYLFLIARHDRRIATDVASLEQQLVARERALRSSLTQIEYVRGERTSEHEQLAQLQDQQRAALAGVRSSESATAERIEQLERDESRLAALLAELERRRRDEALGRGDPTAGASRPGEPAAAALSAASMGTLEWPIDGRVLYGFGRATQPNGTTVRWNGAGIAGTAGAPVRAVEAGVVALAGPFEGYGPTVILSHGGGYYTLYLYLRDLVVGEGEEVRRGQPIGTVGGGDPATGPFIEFQLRIPGGQAVDPLPWLRRR
jgi:murein hydrolase activator